MQVLELCVSFFTVPDILEALAMHVQVVAMSLEHKQKVHMTLAHVEGGKLVC